MTTEIIPREKCRFCKVYLAKGCLNDICLECSKKNVNETLMYCIKEIGIGEGIEA